MIELAQIVGVHADTKSVDLRCVNTHRTPVSVPLLYQNMHPDHAGGVDFMPEEGAYCFVAFPSDTAAPFILGFINKPSYGAATDDSGNPLEEPDPVPELSYSYNRAALDPGDYRVATADGNHLILRRGGIVEIGSTPLAQLMFIPIENVVRFYAQRYQLRSPLGEIDWGHVELTNNGVIKFDATKPTPVLVKYGIKETAQETVTEHYTVEVRAGQVDEETQAGAEVAHHFAHSFSKQDVQEFVPPKDNGVLSVCIFDHSANNKTTFVFQVNREGNVYMQAEMDIYLHARKLFISADELKAKILDILGLDAPKVVLGGLTYDVPGGFVPSSPDAVAPPLPPFFRQASGRAARTGDTVKTTIDKPTIQAIIAGMAAIAGGGDPVPYEMSGAIASGSSVVEVK